MDLTLGSHTEIFPGISHTEAHSEFDLIKVGGYRFAVDQTGHGRLAARLLFEFELKRQSSYATHLLLAPCLICSFLIPFVFLVPLGTNDRMMFGELSINSDCWCCMSSSECIVKRKTSFVIERSKVHCVFDINYMLLAPLFQPVLHWLQIS